MGYRSAFQETMDHIEEGRIHARHWPAVDLPQAEREMEELNRRRDRSRLCVLANRQASLWLVTLNRLTITASRAAIKSRSVLAGASSSVSFEAESLRVLF
jgi:hypothetical protein